MGSSYYLIKGWEGIGRVGKGFRMILDSSKPLQAHPTPPNPYLLEEILPEVMKPGRYIGGEWNAVTKDFDAQEVKFCLCFPDTYEIGMSHLGSKILYHLLNEQEGVCCERAFAPWVDMEELMRKKGLALFSLESKRPLRDFDIVGFSLSYEMNYTNVLNMLDLAGIPFKAKDRGEEYPLVIAGGACVGNPEPMSQVFDAFLIGEAEEAALEMLQVFKEKKVPGTFFSKNELLKRWSKIEGVYIPQFPKRIKKRIVRDFENAYYPTRQIVPYIQIVHDRISIEVMRGCPNRCAFCQATSIYSPCRTRSPETVLRLARETFSHTGYDEVSFVSLSTGDHPKILQIIKEAIAEFKDKGVSVSLPSLRIETMISELPTLIASIKKTGLTFAPEAGSERLRSVINKNIRIKKLDECVVETAKAGWRRVKLYFMIGLPSETDKDIEKIAELILAVANPNKDKNKPAVSVTASISPFVPKPHTPFQWEPMESQQALYNKRGILKKGIHKKSIKLKIHDIELSFLEAVLSRGDRKLADVIMLAWRKGAKFDGWQEFFKYQLWGEALRDCNIDPHFYVERKRDFKEILPWDHIDSGIQKEALWRQRERLGL